MKKIGFILSLLFCSHQALAQFKRQIEESRNHIVKVNPLSPFVGTINIHYETNHHKDASSQVEFFYFGGDLFGQPEPIRGIGLTYNYRYYLTGTYPAGWYVQPYARYQLYWLLDPVQEERINVIGAGVVFGRQFHLGKGIIMDLFLGPSYNEAAENGVRLRAADFIPMFKGPWFRSGFTVGYMF